jgi:DNA/RNA-binding domain of Phe-tRNA-synthetase-like protein
VERDLAATTVPLSPAEESVPDAVTLEDLKAHPVAAAYRRLSWLVKIDPTKNRPAGEALARRILAGKGLPTILPLVDAYNRASARTLVPLGAYDLERVRLPLIVRAAAPGEYFHGIMRDVEALEPGRLVYADSAGGLCGVFLWRDAQATRVHEGSKRVLLLAVGGEPLSPEVGRDALAAAARMALRVGYKQADGPVVVRA